MWMPNESFEFTLPDVHRPPQCSRQDVSEVVKALIAAQALPSGSGCLTIHSAERGSAAAADAPEDPRAAILQFWCVQGLVELLLASPTCRCWRATALLFEALKVCYALQFSQQPKNPTQPLDKRAEVSLPDCTRWELVQHLRASGWDEQEVLEPRERRPPFVVAENGPKVWYYWRGSGRLYRSYLLVLLHVDRLAALGIETVAHNLSSESYSKILVRMEVVSANANRRKRPNQEDVRYLDDSGDEARGVKRLRSGRGALNHDKNTKGMFCLLQIWGRNARHNQPTPLTCIAGVKEIWCPLSLCLVRSTRHVGYRGCAGAARP